VGAAGAGGAGAVQHMCFEHGMRPHPQLYEIPPTSQLNMQGNP
jgi:hypothetical protein